MEKKRKENYTKSQKNEVIQFSQLNFFFFFFNIFPLQFYHRDQNPVIQSLAGNSLKLNKEKGYINKDENSVSL